MYKQKNKNELKNYDKSTLFKMNGVQSKLISLSNESSTKSNYEYEYTFNQAKCLTEAEAHAMCSNSFRFKIDPFWVLFGIVQMEASS